jgi:acetate kinase
MKVIVLNAGSSTYKSAIFDLTKKSYSEPPDPIWKGVLDFGEDSKTAILRVTVPDKEKNEKKISKNNLKEYLEELFKTAWIGDNRVLKSRDEIQIAGHRVVHGGEKFSKPTKITQKVKKAIKELFPIAPLHNPANLSGIETLEILFPSIPHIAVFDTAFHSTVYDYASTYPIPLKYHKMGIKRYGFHGISHQYCSQRASSLLNKPVSDLKMITCHLGNGSSLAAIAKGKSIDTTMGFTPMEGLMMGTRCGSIDPGILLYLLREHHIKIEDLDHCLNFDSGFKGISGFSDLREVMQKVKQSEQKSKLAFEMFLHSLVKNIGSLIGVLGGLDVLVFAGGIGENVPDVREFVCRRLNFLGIKLDRVKNRKIMEDQDITLSTSKIKVFVIHTREEFAIAQACCKFKIPK